MSGNPQNTTRFEMKPEHLKLLQRFNVGWGSSCYDGAPAIDPKRPFGNSDWPRDIAEILGLPIPDDETSTQEQRDRFHADMQVWFVESCTALEIALDTLSFVPGVYTRQYPWYGKWTRQAEQGGADSVRESLVEELLAACKIAYEAGSKEWLYQTNQTDRPPTPRSVCGALGDMMPILRAVIAKAEGGGT